MQIPLKSLASIFLVLLSSHSSFAIIGGKVETNAKSVVYILHGDGGADQKPCTGFVVLNPYVIATAAHCLTRPDSQVGAIHIEKVIDLYQTTNYSALVRNSQQHPEKMKKITITENQIFIHKDFRKVDELHSDSQDADIGLIVLNKPLSDVEPLQLSSEGMAQNFTDFTAYGYGETPDSSAGTLQSVQLARGNNLSHFIFSIPTDSKGGVCVGDSGSPAVMEEKGVKVVISMAVASDDPDPITKKCIPSGMYLKLEAFRDWIKEKAPIVASPIQNAAVKKSEIAR
jgi:secreted trypsin-like serine protease